MSEPGSADEIQQAYLQTLQPVKHIDLPDRVLKVVVGELKTATSKRKLRLP
jgi:hypothetical protein